MTGPRSEYVQHIDVGPTKVWDGASSARRYPNGIYQTINHSIVGKNELQITEGHRYQLIGERRGNFGGPFFVIKRDYTGSMIPSRPYSNQLNPYAVAAHYEGPVYENTGYSVNVGWPSPYYSTPTELESFGTNAIANTLPTNPVSSLFVSLAELKNEGLPSALGITSWRNRTNIARAAGGEYLNTQFGWLPLVSSMKDFSHAVSNSRELLAQYERNSGRKIKRRFEFPTETETTVTYGTGRSTCPGVGAIYDTSSYQNYTQTVTKSKRRWFSGAYTYYLPPLDPGGNNYRRNEQLKNYLYGSRVTPEGIWDITPWSWGLDWLGNFGNILKNVGAFRSDGLVLLYGYIMEEGIHSITYTHPEVRFKTYPGEVHRVSATVTTTVKQRRGATPYGFGLNPNSFTGRQWAILAALGLSRGGNQLSS